MNPIKQEHRQAMEYADQAFVARLNGDANEAAEFARKAFEYERRAAEMVVNNLELEPTRSVLHRSAASFAIKCGEMREAERLLAIGLAGNPPEEIANELRDLLSQVHFSRHMSLRGLILEPEEFQFSMTGDAVGMGIMDSLLFIERYNYLKDLIYRTGARIKKERFSDRFRHKKASKGGFDLYLASPRAASFAVSVRIAVDQNVWLPGISPAIQLLDEVMTCLDLFNRSEEKRLKDQIPDPVYRRNFLSLAGKLAPDGRLVKAVGFTTFRDHNERHVQLTTPQHLVLKEPEKLLEEGHEAMVVISGTLKYANALKKEGEIKLTDDKGKHIMVKVPEGIADIVRPNFDKHVRITGMTRDKTIHLLNIEEIED